jgi:hypothetical protein
MIRIFYPIKKTSKRVVLLLLILLALSCSKEEVQEIQRISVNPPKWIKGYWLSKDEKIKHIGWRFTDNDFIEIDTEGTEISKIKTYRVLKLLGYQVKIDEIRNSSEYIVRIDIDNRSTIFRFKKVSSATMIWQNNPYGTEQIIFVKED